VADIQADSTDHHVYAIAAPPRSRQNNLFIIDGTNGHILSQLPTGSGDSSIALDAQRQRAYVSDTGTNTIFVFTFLAGWQSGAIRTQVTQWHIGPHPLAIGVNSRLGRLYVADSSKHKVTVVDEDNGHAISSLEVADLPVAPMRVDEASGRVYLVCARGQELDTIDGNTNTLIAHTPVDPYPEGVAFNTATGRIYVANEGDPEGNGKRVPSDTITVIDKQSLDVLGTFRVGPTPDGVEADAALHRVYIALEDSGAIVELSDSTDIALKVDSTTQQVIVAHQTLAVLRQATTVVLMAMLLTVVGATLRAMLLRWRARGSPQAAQDAESSRSEQHSLR
jgi:DNA-binding beta-propeller fold protein YncE